MPPQPFWYHGVDAVMDFSTRIPLATCGTWQFREAAANGQLALGSYLRPFEQTGPHTAWAVNVLTLRDDKIAEIVSFIGDDAFTAVGLPLTVA